ncbi:MAG: hypothetical protein ABI200_04130, partial [Gaiellales bacterium]
MSSANPNIRFEDVLLSAARLQQLVPDAVLVGGSAAVFHAGHRVSFDHDHVLADLQDRFDAVLDAIETDDGWVLNRLVPGKIILGELGGIETGVRQMIRARPLEVQQATLATGATLVVPTIDEALRVKSFLAVRRNQVRDYLDIAALSERIGAKRAAAVLSEIDDYYADQRSGERSVASQVLRQLADPRPRDAAVIEELSSYRSLDPRWTWDSVREQLAQVADAMVE